MEVASLGHKATNKVGPIRWLNVFCALSGSLTPRRGEYFERPERGRVAIVDAKLLKDAAKVLFDGGFAVAEDGRDFGVALALGNPEEDFGLARSEAELFEGLGAAEVGMETGLGCGVLQALLDGFGAGETSLHRGEEVVPVHGLGQVVVRTAIHAEADVRPITSRGKEDKGYGRKRFVGPQFLHDAVSIELGHHDIAEDEVRLMLPGRFDAHAAVFGGEHFISCDLQEERDVSPHGSLIFDDKNFLFHGVVCYP